MWSLYPEMALYCLLIEILSFSTLEFQACSRRRRNLNLNLYCQNVNSNNKLISERNQHRQTKITQITVNEESCISMGDSYHLHAHP